MSSSLLRVIISVLITAFMLIPIGCGDDGELDGFTPQSEDPPETPTMRKDEHPTKPRLELYPQCANWHDEVLRSQSYVETQWPLQDYVFLVSSFWATEYPIGGVDYRPCVLAEIFAEADSLTSEVHRAAKSMPPEGQIPRENIAYFLSAIYDEPSAVLPLEDIAVAPYPNFDESYVNSRGELNVSHAEMRIRIAAINAIGFTAPKEYGDNLWTASLFKIVARAYRREISLAATWELKNLGATRREFENSTVHLDDSLREYLISNTRWDSNGAED